MTSRSARTLAAGAALACAAVLAGSAPAAADDADRQVVAESGSDSVVKAPIVDLDMRVEGIDAPVEDLTFATESEDGSLTDAENAEERTVTLAADVLFDFDKATLTPKSEKALKEAAAILEKGADGKTVDINGYTDAKGDDAYNEELSKKRAEAVEKELAKLVTGVDVSYETAGKGSADPVAPNEIDGEDNPDGRAKNRRVEIRFPR